jgi:hypothetical protein
VGDGSCKASTLVAIKLAESDIDEERRLSRGGRSGIDVVGYVYRLWGIPIDIVRDRGSKGMDGCPLTLVVQCDRCLPCDVDGSSAGTLSIAGH